MDFSLLDLENIVFHKQFLICDGPGSGCRVELFTGGYLILSRLGNSCEPEERAFGSTYWETALQNPLILPTIDATGTSTKVVPTI